MGRATEDRHGNWIAGLWGGSKSGAVFRVDSPLIEAPEAHLCWPRSGSAEVSAALRSAVESRSLWQKLSLDARRAKILDLAQSLEDSLDLELATLLDLEDADLFEHLSQLTGRLRDLAPRTASERFGSASLVLARPDWRHLFLGFEAMLTALLAGAPVFLLADARVPQLGRALARAAEEAELPAGSISLLCDDGWTVARAAIASGEVTHIVASGPRATLRELAGIAERASGVQASSGFGAGLAESAGRRERGSRLEFEETRSRTSVLRSGRGLESEIERILEASLGRAGALDGLLHGRIGNVLCPEEVFSRFTERFLSRLDEEETPLHGPLNLDPELASFLARAQERGLDEGATLLRGELKGRDKGNARDEDALETPRGGFFPGARGAILVPTVFTNVEEHMQLVRTARPVPLLCLLRVDSEEAGDELATRLDAPRFL